MPTTTTSYTETLQLFCQGDNKALGLLYVQWVPELYLIAHRYIPQQQEAQDVVADCFEKLFVMSVEKRKQKFIVDGVPLKSLLLVMVKNKSLDTLKVKKNRNSILAGIKHFLPAVVYNASKQTLTEDAFMLLLTCLPKEESALLKLQIQGFSVQEISQLKGISEKTIKNKMTKARKKVKELWKVFLD